MKGKASISSADEATQPQQNGDAEGQTKKLKYPKQIAFIISNEFCERFNYYGMRTILVLYLTQKLFFTDDDATMLYHAFSSAVYFFCVFGGIVADSWLGKFKTIVYLSIVYAVGSVIISLGAIPTLNLPGIAITGIGLFLIALGSGGIKPCVAAFGGDQFKMPEQAHQIGTYFSLFYFSINAGSMISTFVTPILRGDVKCFGDTDCYSLAFGVPAILMVTSIIIFVLGKFMYISRPSQGNMVVKVFRCIRNGLRLKKKEKKINPREHWLDYAEETDGKQLVSDIKALLNVLVLYIPLPIFWTLFDQQGSRWTFQATRMDGELTENFSLKPDQMQVVNPLLILVFIPLYDVLFYPLLAKIGVRRPLQKLTLGGVLAGVAFVISAILELQLEKTYPVIPASGQAHLRIFNGLECDANINFDNIAHTIPSTDVYTNLNFVVGGDGLTYNAQVSASCAPVLTSFTINLYSGKSQSYLLMPTEVEEFEDDSDKSTSGFPLVNVLANLQTGEQITFTDSSGKEQLVVLGSDRNHTGRHILEPSRYTIKVSDSNVIEEKLRLGGVHTIVALSNTMKFHTISEPNSINMFWIVPQYVVMTLGEVMYSVTGLEFSYSQAPVSMKSVIQSAWLLTVGVGNLIVVIITGAKFFDSQASEFFLFAGLMFVDMAIFAVLAYRYKYVKVESGESDDNQEDVGLASIQDATHENTEKMGHNNPSYKDD